MCPRSQIRALQRVFFLFLSPHPTQLGGGAGGRMSPRSVPPECLYMHIVAVYSGRRAGVVLWCSWLYCCRMHAAGCVLPDAV